MRRFKDLLILAYLVPFLAIVSCEKGRPEFGNQFIDETEKMGVMQISSNHFAVSNDSIGYSPVIMFKQASLGQVADPTFGKSTAHFATELLPRIAEELDFREGTVFDSAFLDMHFVEAYGSNPMRIRVYQLKDTISRADPHVVDEKYAGGSMIGEITLQPNETHARIHLAADWAKQFVLGAKDKLKDINSFRVYFPGIYVQGSSDGGSDWGRMLTFYATDLRNRMSFYWTVGGKQYSMHIAPSIASRRYSALAVDTEGTELGRSLALTRAQQQQQSVYYIAGQGRAVGHVDFTALREQWKDSITVALVRAELRIYPVAPSSQYGDTLITQFSSFYKDNGSYYRIPDQAINAGVYHGLYNRQKGYYSLNITMFMQQVLAGKITDNTMYLFADELGLGYDRVVLASPLHTEKPMTLILTYTRL